jgi:hypothetical protein
MFQPHFFSNLQQVHDVVREQACGSGKSEVDI